MNKQTIYLKGYYGYKNFGDELLLLGVLQYLNKQLDVEKIIIETPDPLWMKEWLQRHQHVLADVSIEYVTGLIATITGSCQAERVVIGGGEVVTDARSSPHNGWNYLLRNYWLRLLGKKIWLAGGFGEPRMRGSKILHWLLYTGAERVVTREDTSYERVSRVVGGVGEKVIGYHDFAYDILKYFPKMESTENTHKEKTTKTCIINCNPYIWSQETKESMMQYVKEGGYTRIVYFPAELSIDAPMYNSLHEALPTLEWYDWTTKSLGEITRLFMSAGGGIAARLHVLLLLDYYGIPYHPLVYQEKITKILGHA